MTQPMSPFQIRLELLKMAKDLLVDEAYQKREVINDEWNNKVLDARNKGEAAPAHPGHPPFPTEEEIIKKAMVMNSFVSQTAIPETKTKKSNS